MPENILEAVFIYSSYPLNEEYTFYNFHMDTDELLRLQDRFTSNISYTLLQKWKFTCFNMAACTNLQSTYK